MKRAAASLAFASALAGYSFGDGGLYLVPPGENGTSTIEDGELVWRLPVKRQVVTRASLRHDTEDRSILWLELHLKEWRDPGDHVAHFKHASKEHWQFKVRGSGENEGGALWVMRFDDLAKGRVALDAVSKTYKLDGKNAIDKTKGEQVTPPPRR